MAQSRGTLRSLGTAVRLMVICTVALGVAYPVAVWGVGQVAFPSQSNGSPVRGADGRVVGSSQIGQSFTTAKGAVIDEWFQSRPSAAGDGYDANASSGSNLGPNNPDLRKSIEERKQQLAEADGVPASEVPADAVTASGSGLDPDISPAFALQQVDRVATARGLSADAVRRLVDEHTAGRQLGFLGDPTVNVLELNIALTKLS
ncbi:potassium-transporting ATPase subunit KdpC [Curtobacterium sp. 9128]|uniref:potassium-transporting ATPase subunit KdpC n=1 Tax=Curtobacterium sp. 9128 TaxID=1793722 RepID=UPI0011A9C53E|nr:potassium-transporting ATPase subunit KdpC [Curtobacterium sp. 9128]